MLEEEMHSKFENFELRFEIAIIRGSKFKELKLEHDKLEKFCSNNFSIRSSSNMHRGLAVWLHIFRLIQTNDIRKNFKNNFIAWIPYILFV